MPSFTKSISLLLITCLFLLHPVLAQKVIVNTNSGIYTINEGAGLCDYTDAGPFCEAPNFSGTIFSSALHKDTLYFITFNHILYRTVLGHPGTCTELTSFPQAIANFASLNSLTCDKDGMLYAADAETRQLFHYNPYTNTKTILGVLNVRPGGDLIFYKEKLMLTVSNGDIYEVNISNPAASTLYISIPGRVFFALVAVPFDCNKNKYYGLEWWLGETRLQELDMENKTITGIDCTLPVLAFDGASAVDDGTTLGVMINTIIAKPSCSNNLLTDIQAKAYTAATGVLSYTLDGGAPNNTGIFTGLAAGIHNLRVRNSINCFADTAIDIKGFPPASLSVVANKVDPVCKDMNGGSITVRATGTQQPYTLRLNNAIYNNGSTITGLTRGNYGVEIINAYNCPVDTVSITLDAALTPECDVLFIPTAFTPDGNGRNDTFQPYAGNIIQGYTFRVYNRWGQQVFSTTEKNKGWDGTFNGVTQPSGIFAWVVTYHTLTNPEKKMEKGTVMLIR